MIQRIAQGTQVQIRVSLYVDGALTDPAGATTIQVLREDGTELVAAGAATDNVDTGLKGYTLTPDDTADLDVLTAYWTAVDLAGADQVFKTQVEVVGDFYFTVAEAQAISPLQTFSVAQIIDARTQAEQALEEECGAFVPRYARETYSGDGAWRDGTLLIVRERITEIVSATIDGEVLDSTDLALLIPVRDGIHRATGWPLGQGNIELKYIHGFTVVPAMVKRAALQLTRRFLAESPVDPRATRVTQEGATIDYMIDSSMPFDIPEVNSVVQRYGHKAPRLT